MTRRQDEFKDEKILRKDDNYSLSFLYSGAFTLLAFRAKILSWSHVVLTRALRQDDITKISQHTNILITRLLIPEPIPCASHATKLFVQTMPTASMSSCQMTVDAAQCV